MDLVASCWKNPKNFCVIPNNLYRSQPFQFGDDSHILSIFMMDGKPMVHLSALRDLSGLSDNREFFAADIWVPTLLKAPKRRNKQPHLFAQCDKRGAKVTMEFNFRCGKPPEPRFKPACTNNNISFKWGGAERRSVPSFFKGQIEMDYISQSIIDYTALVTDLHDSVPLQITLTPVFPAPQ